MGTTIELTKLGISKKNENRHQIASALGTSENKRKIDNIYSGAMGNFIERAQN